MKTLDALPLFFEGFYTHHQELPRIYAPSDRVFKFINILKNDFYFSELIQISDDFKKIVLKNNTLHAYVVLHWDQPMEDLSFLNKSFPLFVHEKIQVLTQFELIHPKIAINPNRSEPPYPDENQKWSESLISKNILLKHDDKTLYDFMLTKMPTFKTGFNDFLFKTLIEEKIEKRPLTAGIFDMRCLALELKSIETHLLFFSNPIVKELVWLESEYAPEGYARLLYKGLLIKSELVPPGWLIEVERSLNTIHSALTQIKVDEMTKSHLTHLELNIQAARSVTKKLSMQTYTDLSKTLELNNSDILSLHGFYFSHEAFFVEHNVIYLNRSFEKLVRGLMSLRGLSLSEAQIRLEIFTRNLFE